VEKTEQQTCLDCLHCKVSAKSTVEKRLCFCAVSPGRKLHRELYWAEKKLCGSFDSMDSLTITPPHRSRRPLLKGADFLGGLRRQGKP
jgi:hypothetical protein